MLNKNKLLDLLNIENIKYSIYDHEALFSVNDSVEKRGHISGAHTKNLFLKDKKNNYYLVSCLENTNINLKNFNKAINAKNLSFASEEKLMQFLGVRAGAVSPFGLLNDKQNLVKLFLDYSLNDFEFVNFHPLENTSTVNLKFSDLIVLLKKNKINLNFFDFNSYSLI
tara:strand:- start:720 stop:1223 length:504 start_codon:yes stop_codon:yes gene_type:complete